MRGICVIYLKGNLTHRIYFTNDDVLFTRIFYSIVHVYICFSNMFMSSNSCGSERGFDKKKSKEKFKTSHIKCASYFALLIN